MTNKLAFLGENPSQLAGCVYYSQNREDLTLASFFPEIEKGFYIDVGAYDPDEDSVTKLFYLRGWHGINIEPQPSGYELFEKKRKRDINLNLGVSDKKGSLKLRTYTSGGLSTFSDNIKKRYESNPNDDTRDFKEITVPVMPLKEVFDKNNVEHIHFMKVDVEGHEYQVLESNDWKKYRPEVLCIEANHVEHDWRPLLFKANYEFVFNDCLNDYYADKNTNRKSKFNYVKDVINDRGGGIRAEHFEQLEKLYRYASDKTHHVEELRAYADDLERQLQEAHKKTTKQLNKLVSRNLKSRIKKG
jgi:FkbM family methyltransferase